MNRAEAMAVNLLLDWVICGRSSTTGGVLSDQDAEVAFSVLARAAYHTLSEGASPGDVTRRFARRRFRSEMLPRGWGAKKPEVPPNRVIREGDVPKR